MDPPSCREMGNIAVKVWRAKTWSIFLEILTIDTEALTRKCNVILTKFSSLHMAAVEVVIFQPVMKISSKWRHFRFSGFTRTGCIFKSNPWCVSFIFGLFVIFRYVRWCFDEIRLFKETNVPDWPLHTEQLPNSQILECTCSISHNAPFRTEVCTLLFWMEHCGIWNRCILGFVKLVYLKRSNTVHPKKYAHWSSFVVFCCGLISNIYFVASGAILILMKKGWMIWMSTVIH